MIESIDQSATSKREEQILVITFGDCACFCFDNLVDDVLDGLWQAVCLLVSLSARRCLCALSVADIPNARHDRAALRVFVLEKVSDIFFFDAYAMKHAYCTVTRWQELGLLNVWQDHRKGDLHNTKVLRRALNGIFWHIHTMVQLFSKHFRVIYQRAKLLLFLRNTF